MPRADAPPCAFEIVILILWSRLGTPFPERTELGEYHGIEVVQRAHEIIRSRDDDRPRKNNVAALQVAPFFPLAFGRGNSKGCYGPLPLAGIR